MPPRSSSTTSTKRPGARSGTITSTPPLTYQKSYFARLNYVHRNAVKHGLVDKAADYPWCSAAWFAKQASPAFRKTIASFKTDRVKVYDDF